MPQYRRETLSEKRGECRNEFWWINKNSIRHESFPHFLIALHNKMVILNKEMTRLVQTFDSQFNFEAKINTARASGPGRGQRASW